MKSMGGQPFRIEKLALPIIVLSIAGCLLFARLGHYALWDDEAYTALTAEGVCTTADTSVVLGHNVFAWSNGSTLKNLRDRFFPPLPAYLAAASMTLLGRSAFAARLPFAFCGIATFAVLLRWLRIDRVDRWTTFTHIVLLLLNVSLILYFRQCRYYGLSIFLCIAIAFLWVHFPATLWRQFVLVFLVAALFATQYFCFGAMIACATVDWFVWGRRSIRISRARGMVLLLTLASLIVIHVMIWSPLGAKAAILNAAPGTLGDDLLRVWWNIRDTNVNEFWCVPLLLIVPFVGWKMKDAILLRGSAAAIVYFATVSAIAPHGTGKLGEIRYFCALIPLALFLEARTVRHLSGSRPALGSILAVMLLGSNVLSGSTVFATGLFSFAPRITLVSYVKELLNPPPDCYQVTSNWLNANLPADRSILVWPEFSMYPLMFHSPQFVYAWQLTAPPAAQFRDLPPIHFKGRIAPDYIVMFGEEGLLQSPTFECRTAEFDDYSLKKIIPIFGKDLYRPELFLRSFDASPTPNLKSQAVYVLQKN